MMIDQSHTLPCAFRYRYTLSSKLGRNRSAQLNRGDKLEQAEHTANGGNAEVRYIVGDGCTTPPVMTFST